MQLKLLGEKVPPDRIRRGGLAGMWTPRVHARPSMAGGAHGADGARVIADKPQDSILDAFENQID